MIEDNIKNVGDSEILEIVKDLSNKFKDDVLSEQFDMVAFSRGFRQGANSYATPQMVNTNLKSVNLNPQVATYEETLRVLQNPNTNEDKVVSYSQDQYLTNTLYKRTFDYYANLPAFNLSIQCKNASMADYSTKAYEKDWKLVTDFLNKFNYKEEFRKAFFNMLNADMYPCMLRKDLSRDKYVLQDFPYKYARISGRFSHGLVCDYDLSFLMNGTQDINMYPPKLRKKYRDLLNSNNKGYLPSANLDDRTRRSWALWVQTSPEDGNWVFKFTDDMITNIPYFSPMILDTLTADIYRTLQMNQNISSARKIITSQWPMIKDNKGANQTDALSVRSETMGSLIAACMNGLNSNGELFNMIVLPSDKIEVTQMENKNQEMYSNYLKTVSGLMGGANTLFSTQKQTATESLMSADIDKMLVEKIYHQFNNFLEYYINALTRKFNFEFKFSGTNSYVDKEARKKEALELGAVGVVSINKLANALDLDQIQLRREMEMSKATGIADLFMPMLNMYTESKNSTSDDKGRPQSSTTDISDSGSETRDSGANVDRGGKI